MSLSNRDANGAYKEINSEKPHYTKIALAFEFIIFFLSHFTVAKLATISQTF